MYGLNYCITHNSYTKFPVGLISNCIITSCPPPELDMSDEWLDSLVPPTPQEFKILEFRARQLKMDFS